MILKNQVVPGTVNAGPHDFEAAIADLDTGFQRWPEALRVLLSARTPIDKAVACLHGRSAGLKSVIILT